MRLFTLLLLSSPAWAQFSTIATGVTKGANLPATCGVGSVYYKTTATTGFYTCGPTANNWVLMVSTGGGSTIPNCADTAGQHLNYNSTTGVFTCGTSSAGVITSGTQYQMAQYSGNGSTVAGVSIPACADSSGNHLNFDNSTGVFTCGNTGNTAVGALMYTGTANPNVPVIAPIQSAKASNTLTLAYASNVTAGNLLVAIGARNQAGTLTGFTDTQGNTYTQKVYQTSSGTPSSAAAIYTAIASATGANTVTMTGWTQTTSTAMMVIEFGTNVSNPASFDGNTGNTTWTNLTASAPYSLLIGVTECQGSTAATLTNMTLIDRLTFGSTFSVDAAYRVMPSSGSTSGTSMTAGGAVPAYAEVLVKAAVIASFGANGDWFFQSTSGYFWQKSGGNWAVSAWHLTP